MENLETYSSGNTTVGLNSFEKHINALTKLFVPEVNTSGIPAFKSLSQAYTQLTGDLDMSGTFKPDRISRDLRACQDFNSGSFAFALQNAMNMYLSKSYKEFPFHEEVLISQKNKVLDLRKIHSVQLNYFGELPDIDPEAQDYDDIMSFGDSAALYELSRKGAIVWVTEQVVFNDKIGVIQNIIKRLARSARLAHAKYVWKFFINNALCPDGTEWFSAAHGNLASAALDIAPLVTAIKALANMEEPGPSTELLGLDLATFNWNLVVPINMWDTAVKKNQCDSTFTSNDLTTKEPNPCHKLFGDRNERIITCPFITDANDWGVIRDCEDVPIVEMSYWNGNEEPEFFTGDSGKGMRIFQSEKIGYKIRHEYGGAVADYRGGYKSIVP